MAIFNSYVSLSEGTRYGNFIRYTATEVSVHSVTDGYRGFGGRTFLAIFDARKTHPKR